LGHEGCVVDFDGTGNKTSSITFEIQRLIIYIAGCGGIRGGSRRLAYKCCGIYEWGATVSGGIGIDIIPSDIRVKKHFDDIDDDEGLNKTLLIEQKNS